MKAVRLLIRGRVQGVGFRWSAREVATRAGVGGWVRNRPDGAVEMHLEGPADAVDRVRRWVSDGPGGARVDDVTEAAVEPEGADSFRISA